LTHGFERIREAGTDLERGVPRHGCGRRR